MGKIGVLRCVAAAASAVCLPALSANFPEPQSFATVGLITYSVEDTNPGDGIDAGVFLIQPDSVHGIDMTAVSGSLSVADFQSPGVQDVLQQAVHSPKESH